MTMRTITAIFDSAADAQEAQARLLSLGLAEADVRLVGQSTTAGYSADQNKGFWESIKDFFVADDDRATYSEGVRRGGCLLTARIDDARADEAIAILESTNAVDLEEREQQWRSEGWTGAEYETGGAQYSRAPDAGEAGYSRTTEYDESQYSRADEGSEEAIPIVRERLRVGKREVDRGGVRVRSYIVEEPVNEQVELREERVEVERRPARRPASTAEASEMLRERTIEVTERGEEAVVQKDAEVTEEVVVRKFEGQRTEGVSDTVRHTEVEVDDTRVDPSTVQPPTTRGKRGRSDSKPLR